MIRKVFLLLSIVMSFCSWGQTIYVNGASFAASSDILTPGRSWLMSYKLVLNPDVYPTTYSFQESVLLPEKKDIDGIPCMELAVRDWSPENTEQEWKRIGSYLGEKDGKVYLFKRIYDELIKRLILDFSLQTGDTFFVDGYEDYVGLTVETVTDTIMPRASDDRSRLCISLSNDRYGNDVWVEGIGSVYYGITGNMRFMVTGGVPLLVRCSQGDQLLYEADDFQAITGISSQKSTTSVHHSFMYDLQGRRLKGEPKRGLYIKDGKKVVKR